MRMIKIAVLGLLAASCAGAVVTGDLSLNLTELAPGTRAGGKVMVRVTTLNESDHPITYRNTNSCNYSFKVFTSAGTLAPETEQKKQVNCESKGGLEITGRDILMTLKPGESSGENITLTEWYDMSQPGEYSVQVDRTFPGVGHFSSNIVYVTVAP